MLLKRNKCTVCTTLFYFINSADRDVIESILYHEAEYHKSEHAAANDQSWSFQMENIDGNNDL